MGAGGAGLDDQVLDHALHQLPAAGVVVVSLAVVHQDGAQLGESGAGGGGVGKGDLALPLGVGQVLPGLGEVGLGHQVGVNQEHHGQGGLADPQVLGIIQAGVQQVDAGGLIGLEVLLVGGQGVGAAAPEYVGHGGGGLGGDAVEQVAGAVGHHVHLNVRILVLKHLDARVQGIAVMGGVDGQLAGVVLGLLLAVAGGLGLGGSALSRSAGLAGLLGGVGVFSAGAGHQAQRHHAGQQQGDPLFHFHVFHSSICRCRRRPPPLFIVYASHRHLSRKTWSIRQKERGKSRVKSSKMPIYALARAKGPPESQKFPLKRQSKRYEETFLDPSGFSAGFRTWIRLRNVQE